MEKPPQPQLTSEEAEKLKLFLASVTDYAIYMLSPSGHVVTWNAGARRFKGYEEREIIGEHFSRFYTPEDQAIDLPRRALQESASHGKFEAEGWRVRKDGTRFWASVVIDPIRDQRGELLGFAKITRDITEKKRTQEALRESEERFRLLVQGVADYAIYMLSPEGEITNWNSGARRIKGYEQDEVVGSNFARFYTPEDQAIGLPARALATAAEQGRFEAEGWRIRKGGTRFWAHVVIDAIRNEMGQLIGFAKITRDITERKKAAAELEQAKEALFQSQKLEAIGKLTGGVAHDFNNLLNVLSNGLSIFRQRLKDPADLRMLETMEQATKRGASLTQQLLSFARQQPLRQEQRNLHKVVASFEAVLRRAVRSGVTFEREAEARLPLALIDVTQFETALLNLVVNAADATPPGGKIVVFTQSRRLDEGQSGQPPAGLYVAAGVRDSGTGMSGEVRDRAIEPFFTTKETGKGTGLGLSQVYGLVQQSGGKLIIESEVGKGTTVTMLFPALGADEVERATDSNPSVERVLVVDDQKDVLELTAELFRTLGFDVLTVARGDQALEILKREGDVHFLFTDVVMPGMSGLDLAQQARLLNPDLKVILASGYAGQAARDGSLEGFQFLPKPYQLGDLVRKLRAVG